MEPVGNVNNLALQDGSVLRGARSFEIVELVSNDPSYTEAFSLEYVRIAVKGHSVPHVNIYNHFLYVIEGEGEISIEGRKWPVTSGSYAKVKAGARHSLLNLGEREMILLAIYDPPRTGVVPRNEIASVERGDSVQ